MHMQKTGTGGNMSFDFYSDAAELNKKPKATQVATVLHVAGPDAEEIHSMFIFNEEESSDDYENNCPQKIQSTLPAKEKCCLCKIHVLGKEPKPT